MTMASTKEFVSALDRGLDDLEHLLDDSLTNETYALNPVPGFTSGIGPHVRHILDHLEALLHAAESCGVIDYDRRERGTPEETSRMAGINRLQTLRSRLWATTFPSDETSCDIRIMLASDAPPGAHQEFLVPGDHVRLSAHAPPSRINGFDRQDMWR